MAGVRVLVSGMGGELGSRVASLLEEQSWVGSLEGIDVDPPRRRLRRTVFHRIVPGQHDRTVDTVMAFNPHVVVHVAVWEPHARAGTETARSLTDDAVTSILGAAAECRALESIVVRSGIEIYGRARGSVTRPSEVEPRNPTSEYGRMVVSSRHKYIVYDEGKAREQLMDLQNDPGEMKNHIDYQDLRDVLSAHRSYMARQWPEHDNSS